jgi:hypothetical protein
MIFFMKNFNFSMNLKTKNGINEKKINGKEKVFSLLILKLFLTSAKKEIEKKN